jgi:hypothetical protein
MTTVSCATDAKNMVPSIEDSVHATLLSATKTVLVVSISRILSQQILLHLLTQTMELHAKNLQRCGTTLG